MCLYIYEPLVLFLTLLFSRMDYTKVLIDANKIFAYFSRILTQHQTRELVVNVKDLQYLLDNFGPTQD